MKKIAYVGLDVHAETIAVAVAEEGRSGEVRSVGVVPNRPDALRRLLSKLGRLESLRCCYEAGPTGYALYWQLTRMGIHCEVIAPSLVPVKAGDRVKTDRRDAIKLARCYRSGELTAVWVPDAAHEALRDLVRAREACKKDEVRARHRLQKMLLRQGRRAPDGTKAWTGKYMKWIKEQRFELPAQEAAYLDYLREVEHQGARLSELERSIDAAIDTAPKELRELIAALQALRGVAKLTATTIVVEVGSFARFSNPREIMSYSGMVSREHSSGERERRGGITKTGNAHLRRILVESAQSCCRHRPLISKALRKRQEGLDDEVKAIAWKAQLRLHRRYTHLTVRGKQPGKAIVAVARELLGFVWAVGVHTEHAAMAAATTKKAA